MMRLTLTLSHNSSFTHW